MEDSQAAIICYDVSNEDSIKNLEEWIREYENNNPCEFVISIVGNKVSFWVSSAKEKNPINSGSRDISRKI